MVKSAARNKIYKHTSLNQLQREIKESINFAFTRSCNEGVVSYSFWAPQVRAAQMLRKTAIWTARVEKLDSLELPDAELKIQVNASFLPTS